MAYREVLLPQGQTRFAERNVWGRTAEWETGTEEFCPCQTLRRGPGPDAVEGSGEERAERLPVLRK